MKFAKAAENKFSTEIFRIFKVIDRRPRAVYELGDINGRPLDELFYQEELLPYASPAGRLIRQIKYWSRKSDVDSRISNPLARVQSGL